MEETVRSMLVYKKQAEQLRQEKNALTLAFEVSDQKQWECECDETIHTKTR